MIIRTTEELTDTTQHVKRKNWSSKRMVIASDNLGFSMHITRIYPGKTGVTHYPDHVEAAYCVQGVATVFYEDGRRSARIVPGTMYALNDHDMHTMLVEEELVLLCVFNPALIGSENAATCAKKESDSVK